MFKRMTLVLALSMGFAFLISQPCFASPPNDDCAPGYHVEHRPTGDVCVPDNPPPPPPPPRPTPETEAPAPDVIDQCYDIYCTIRTFWRIFHD